MALNITTPFKFDISQELEDLKRAFSCKNCHNLMVKPVALNTCGHVQCESCLDKKKLQCSICKSAYNEIDITASSITETVVRCIRNIEKIGKKVSIPENKNDGVDDIFNGIFEIVIAKTAMKKNHKGETPLHLACKRGKLDKVVELIESGVDINATDWGNWSPLHEAVQSKRIECVELLLKNRALIDIPGVFYMTPLHEAISCDAGSIAELLINYGADRSALDKTGQTPLNYISDKENFKYYENIMSSKVYIPKVFVDKEILVYCKDLSEEAATSLSRHGVKFVNCKEYHRKDEVTHLIMLENVVNLDFLFAVVKGIFIVSKSWAVTFPPKIIPFENIPKEFFDTIKRSIRNRLQRKPKLFSDINFHIVNHERKIKVHSMFLTKADITLLIQAGGGKIVTRSPALRTVENENCQPYHARNSEKLKECGNYIIYDEQKEPALMYNMKELQHRSSKWLIDCILEFRITD